MSEQTNSEVDDLRRELVSYVRDSITSGRICLRKRIGVYTEDLDVFVYDKAVLLGGLDVLTADLDISISNDRKKARSTLYVFTNYTMLTASGIVNTWLPLGDYYDFTLSERLIKLLESYHAVDMRELSYGLHVGSVRDLEISLSAENRLVFNISYKVEWDGETRIEV
jgi:hypothetical protein